MSDMAQKTAKPGAKPVDADADIESQLHAIRTEVTAMTDMLSAFVKEKVHAFGATAEAVGDEASARARKARQIGARRGKSRKSDRPPGTRPSFAKHPDGVRAGHTGFHADPALGRGAP